MDSLVYARLTANTTLVAALGTSIQPVMPQEDAQLPYLYYWRLETQDTRLLSGASVRPRAYTYAFDIFSFSQATARAIADTLNTDMLAWRNTDVQGAFLQTSASQQEDKVYHIQALYQIWS